MECSFTITKLIKILADMLLVCVCACVYVCMVCVYVLCACMCVCACMRICTQFCLSVCSGDTSADKTSPGAVSCLRSHVAKPGGLRGVTMGGKTQDSGVCVCLGTCVCGCLCACVRVCVHVCVCAWHRCIPAMLRASICTFRSRQDLSSGCNPSFLPAPWA